MKQLIAVLVALVVLSVEAPAVSAALPSGRTESEMTQPGNVLQVEPSPGTPAEAEYFSGQQILSALRPAEEMIAEAAQAKRLLRRLERTLQREPEARRGRALDRLSTFAETRQMDLANLYDDLASIPAGAAPGGRGLRIAELPLTRGRSSFVVLPIGVAPHSSVRELYGDPRSEDSSIERLALYTEQDGVEALAIPERRGFASTVRVSSGTYGWKSGNRGRVKLTWIKDKVVDSNAHADWFVYTSYVDADPYARRWARDYFVYDIDVINGITSGSSSGILNDSVQRNPGTVTSGCSKVDLGAGIHGLSVGSSYVTCNKSYEKGDRFGGMHMEYRANCSFWTGYSKLGNRTVSVGYSIEVKTTPRHNLFWWDYGDAAFGVATRDCSGKYDLDEVVL